MINIPATDIMSLITGEVDKTAMADRPQAAEVSFMGVINAEGSRSDEQAGVLGFLMNADMAHSDLNPANFAIAAPIFANNQVQIQQDAGPDMPVSGGPANNGTASSSLLVDDKPILPAFAPYSQSTQSVVRADSPMATPITFGPEPDPKSGENQTKTAVEMTGVQARNNKLSAGHPHPAGNAQTPRLSEAQPANGMLTDKMESPRMATLSLPGDPGMPPNFANTALQQTVIGRAGNQTPIAPIERLKPETALLDETLSRQQVAVADPTNRKTIEQANQGPVPRSINPEPISAGPPPSQRASKPQHPAPQSPELPVSHTAPDRLQTAPTPADKPPTSQAGNAIAQHAPPLNSHEIPEVSPSKRVSAEQDGPAQAPANRPDSPKVSALSQPDIQRQVDAPIQAPKRPPIYGAQPPVQPVNTGLASTPEIQSANASTPRLVAQYGAVSKAAARPAAPKVGAPDVTQPQLFPDVSVLKPIAPSSAAFDASKFTATSKAASGDTYKVRSASELPAPKSARPNSPQQTGMPDITKVETGEALATPEFVALEAKSAEIAPLVRHDANLNRPEVMRHVAQQLTDAARQMPDRPVELALNPEELGRVRLTFTTTDAGLHVAVIAERGETMDLLRRHIESLAQDFRDLGYRDVKFDFSGNGARRDANTSGNENADQDQNANPDAAPQDIDAPIQLSLEPSAGLDLRL